MNLNHEMAEQLIPLVAIGGGILVAIVAIVFGCVRAMVSATARERSRREIAAYVAEGSITPEDAARLLNAGKPASCRRG